MRLAIRQVAVLLLGLCSVLSAGMLEDWNNCQYGVLNDPSWRNKTDANTAYCAGLGYLTGYLGQKDYTQAVAYWSKAAAQGHAGAQVALGYTYEKGRGVPIDLVKALSYYRAAAAHNSADANFNLGRLYQNGIGVLANPAEAARYYKLAAAAGSEEASRALAQSGTPVHAAAPGQAFFDQGEQLYRAKNYAGALSLFLQSANAGNPRAQLQVASQYERGEGTAKNAAEAVRWYTRSANAGDPQAMKNVGNLYESGEGVPENWALALRWYQASAAKFEPDGEFALGRMYEFGMAVPQDRGKAIFWFQKAAGLGHSQAAYFAKWLSDPTNNIGFRNNAESALVMNNKLRFAGDLIGADPAGILFHNSQERNAWMLDLRNRVDQTEAMTRWRVQKADHDRCVAQHGTNCIPAGPQPR